MKKIKNIVFYKYFDKEGEKVKSCIFYEDGKVAKATYNEGIDACLVLARERNITTRNAFNALINNDSIYVLSGREFVERFDEFIYSQSEIMNSYESENTPVYQKVMQKSASDEGNLNKDKRVIENEKPVLIPIESADSTSESDEKVSAKKDNLNLNNNADNRPLSEIFDEVFNDNKGKQNDSDESKEIPIDNELSTSDDDNMNSSRNDSSKDDSNDPIISPIPLNNTGNSNSNMSDSDEESHAVNIPISGDDDDSADTDTDTDGLDVVGDMDDTLYRPVGSLFESDSSDESSDDLDEDIEDVEDTDDLDSVSSDLGESSDEDIDEDIEDEDDLLEEEEKEGFFKRIWNKIKQSKIGKKIVAIGLALAIVTGGATAYSCSKHNTKEGVMLNSNITNSQTVSDDNSTFADDSFVYDNNDYYNEYTVDQLLSVTSNETQKTAMTNINSTLLGFNDTFASNHIESGKDIRAALSFDEVVALQQAYNDYSKEEIKSYFNGADIRSSDMVRHYKDATLQLMGAYVIETDESQVDMSYLINSDEGKAFYNKYHKLFREADNATGQDKLDKVKAFYDAVRADFPITEDVRTEGISHADSRDSIESYKLSVTPMIAAAEMMWQNLEVDNTLDDTSIDFLNDIGLCNYAESNFDRIETIVLSSEEDNTNPLYEQYKAAFEKMLAEKNINVIDDEHRELSKLTAFQNKVNPSVIENGSFVYSSGTSYSTETYQETSSYTESSTTYREEQTSESVSESEVPEEERKRIQNEIDSSIEQENDQAKADAEKAAEETRQQMQDEEDENAKKIEEEVKEDEEKLKEDIDQANDQINQNNSDQDTSNDTPVNENDFNGTVDFDDEHSDSDGNLDDSVKDITTDDSNDQTNSDLPDPNTTGAEFDSEASNSSSEETTTSNASTDNSSTGDDSSYSETPDTSTNGGSSDNTSDQTVYEYEETVYDYEQDDTSSNEQAVEDYVNSLAAEDAAEDAYQYTK